MAEHEITIKIDDATLSRVLDQDLALWWHVAQANPANGHTAREPGELAERIGREIIRRWLAKTPPELWHHQGRHYYWDLARRFGKWNSEREFVPHQPVPEPDVVRQALEDAAICHRVHHADAASTEAAQRYDKARAMLDAPAPEAERTASDG